MTYTIERTVGRENRFDMTAKSGRSGLKFSDFNGSGYLYFKNSFNNIIQYLNK